MASRNNQRTGFSSFNLGKVIPPIVASNEPFDEDEAAQERREERRKRKQQKRRDNVMPEEEEGDPEVLLETPKKTKRKKRKKNRNENWFDEDAILADDLDEALEYDVSDKQHRNSEDDWVDE